MILLGVILLVLGLFLFHPLVIIGFILLIIGACLAIANGVGHGVGGRHWY